MPKSIPYKENKENLPNICPQITEDNNSFETEQLFKYCYINSSKFKTTDTKGYSDFKHFFLILHTELFS